MTDNVVELKTRSVVIHQDIITMLERWLEDAKAGDLIAVGLVGVEADGCVLHSYSDNDSNCALLGALERLKHRINLSLDNVTTSV